MNWKVHLESKTSAALIIILGTTVGLAIAGKLTAEVVDVLKYVGTSFFLARTAANFPTGGSSSNG